METIGFYLEPRIVIQSVILWGTRHISGEGYKTMSRVLKVSKSTVVFIIRKLKKYGITHTLPRAGCPTKLSSLATKILVREMTKNPMTTLTEQQSSSAEMGEPARRTTVSTELHQSEFYGRVARRKPLLRKGHMTACLEFANT